MNTIITIIVLLVVTFSDSYAIYANESEENINNDKDWADDGGIWGPLLEEWATGNHRQGRIMMLPATMSIYIAQERSDMISNNTAESKISPGNKIVNNNYSNNKNPPMRQVSETDLYLLGAIEKLVYKVDFMEKRLRRVEEMLYFVMAGNRIDTEPCAENFTRIASQCYHFSSNAGREYDWKTANKLCKKMGGFLAEMETIEENQDLITFIQSNQHLRGKDYWLGGLNPGLLWIWSNSARPVTAPGSQNNKDNPSAAIHGEGRCLKLAYNPALRSYNYKGADCALRYNFVCETTQNTSSNEIRRLGKSRMIFADKL